VGEAVGGTGVLVAVRVAVAVGVPVAVGVGVGVLVAVAVGVAVDVAVGVSVGASVGVLVGASVGVSVGVAGGVSVGVFVAVLVGVGVGVWVGVSLVTDGTGVSVGGVSACTMLTPFLARIGAPPCATTSPSAIATTIHAATLRFIIALPSVPLMKVQC
jgi:hypothetical protein